MSDTTATTTGRSLGGTLAELQRVARILADQPPEPIGVWMREQGFDPARGGILILPERLRAEIEFPEMMPRYVRFSRIVAEPVLCNPEAWKGPR